MRPRQDQSRLATRPRISVSTDRVLAGGARPRECDERIEVLHAVERGSEEHVFGHGDRREWIGPAIGRVSAGAQSFRDPFPNRPASRDSREPGDGAWQRQRRTAGAGRIQSATSGRFA